MSYILLMLVFPILWTAYWVAKNPKKYTWKEGLLSLSVTLLFISIVYIFGSYQNIQDIEIINGKVTGKEKVTDNYVRSYECNCFTTCSGSGQNRTCSQKCSTCYEDRYTVGWYINTTVGRFTVDYIDSTNRKVHFKADPVRYDRCAVGDPAAKESYFKNYIKASPESLFNTSLKTGEVIPEYPRVFDIYKMYRVLDVGSTVPKEVQDTLNDGLNEILKTLGEEKEVNIIVIITNNPDRTYRYAVENVWLGGKKNDVVVFLGMTGLGYVWVDVMTWALNSGNELFRVTLTERIMTQKVLDAKTLPYIIGETVRELYDRPEMEDYSYLVESIQPPLWLYITCLVVSFSSTVLLSYLFYKQEVLR